MRKIGLLLGLMFLVSFSAAAQDAPKAEIFGGYSFIRTGGTNFNGFNGAVAVNPNHWLGIVGDFGGYYHSFAGTTASIYTYTFGPQLSYRKNEKLVPFAHALFGGARAGGGGASANAFATNLGGGVDWVASPSIAIRLVQADALITRFSGNSSTDARLSFGVVFRVK